MNSALQQIENLNPQLIAGASVFLSILILSYILRILSKSSEVNTQPSPKKEAESKKKPTVRAQKTKEPTKVFTDAIEKTWVERLKDGLGKTRHSFQENLSSLFNNNKIDESTLEKLHEILYRADIGVSAADTLVDHVRSTLSKEEKADWEAVEKTLKNKITDILSNNATPINTPKSGPMVILMVGVNGAGKTTTIGKLSTHFVAQGKKVLLCAGDTFRAAAIDQLKVWGERVGMDVVAHKQGSDPAAVAFDGVKAAKARNADVLLIDTAGRLHSKKELMDELHKISKILKREIPEAPHETWLVIDSTTGQNANMQVRSFKEVADVSGLVVTKLDGTAKGGVIIGIAEQFNTPIRYIGVGESAEDLREFKAEEFADSVI